jgi:hypothetical protein
MDEKVNNQNIMITDSEIVEVLKFIAKEVLKVDLFKEKISVEKHANLDFLLRPAFTNSGKGAFIKFGYLPEALQMVVIKELGWKQGSESQNTYKIYCRNLHTKLFERAFINQKDILMNSGALRYKLRLWFTDKLKYNIQRWISLGESKKILTFPEFIFEKHNIGQ